MSCRRQSADRMDSAQPEGDVTMNIIKPYVESITPLDGDAILKHIELCGRVCYKSEDHITADSAERFVAGIIRRGHEAVLEHYSLSVRFVVDRGISHEIVRHRLASYCQESSRYCRYDGDKFGNEITVIEPYFLEPGSVAYEEWRTACQRAEEAYLWLLRDHTPEQARDVLPTSLKTELIMTANLREWRHFFRLRTSQYAHPQMREVAVPLLHFFQRRIPVVFDDILGAGIVPDKDEAAYIREVIC